MPEIRPKTVVVSLQRPACVYVSTTNVDFVKIDGFKGETVELNDSPWISTVADLVVDPSTSSLLGLSFDCSFSRKDFTLAEEVVKRLDPQVVCLKDRYFRNNRELPGLAPGVTREQKCEITWASSHQTESESAQLMNGQWWWFYSNKSRWPGTKPVVAFGINDVDEILDDHGLTFATPRSYRTLEDCPNLFDVAPESGLVPEFKPILSNYSQFQPHHNLLPRFCSAIGELFSGRRRRC